MTDLGFLIQIGLSAPPPPLHFILCFLRPLNWKGEKMPGASSKAVKKKKKSLNLINASFKLYKIDRNVLKVTAVRFA